MSTTQIQHDAGPLERYATGPIHFAGTDIGLYERHLLFDNVIVTDYADTRDRFEAFARSCRDVLSQRWTLTQQTYKRQGAKRIYYLSMEFLIGRSLANNVTNMLLGSGKRTSIGSNSWNRSPMPLWETGDWGGLLPASWNPWRRCSFRRWVTGCAMSTACSSRR
jgi:hypothetical protein